MTTKMVFTLTYLAQVRQRRTSAPLFPLNLVPTERLTLLIKLRAKYGMLYRETATTGIAHAAVSGERNRSTAELLKARVAWQKLVKYSSSQSRARGGV